MSVTEECQRKLVQRRFYSFELVNKYRSSEVNPIDETSIMYTTQINDIFYSKFL